MDRKQLLQGGSCTAAQIRDPYYKFSRDPDMSLDTAPYPAGVPKSGMPAVRTMTHLSMQHLQAVKLASAGRAAEEFLIKGYI